MQSFLFGCSSVLVLVLLCASSENSRSMAGLGCGESEIYVVFVGCRNSYGWTWARIYTRNFQIWKMLRSGQRLHGKNGQINFEKEFTVETNLCRINTNGSKFQKSLTIVLVSWETMRSSLAKRLWEICRTFWHLRSSVRDSAISHSICLIRGSPYIWGVPSGEIEIFKRYIVWTRQYVYKLELFVERCPRETLVHKV